MINLHAKKPILEDLERHPHAVVIEFKVLWSEHTNNCYKDSVEEGLVTINNQWTEKIIDKNGQARSI